MTTYPRADHPIVVEFSPGDLRARLYEALGVYVTAMGYPRGTEHHRAPMWTEHTSRPGWRAFGAIAAGSEADPGTLVAIAYGYHGTPHQWWHQQVLGGMRRAGWTEQSANGLLGDYFEVTELHVHPQAQGHGLGAVLLTRLLDGLTERSALLSTPEVEGENNRAWRRYRRFVFNDIVRNFTFAGDSRPFAVLGKQLYP